MSVLIIGGDSRLSKRLIKNFDIKYYTTRRKIVYPNNNLYLDLEDVEDFEIPSDVSECLIIGGPVSYSQANEKQNLVMNIHENKIPQLAHQLLKKNIYTVYVSSNMVIGKVNTDRSEDSTPNPNINYGLMKYICEKNILETAKKIQKEHNLAILRLTKNLSPETSPIDKWIKSYKYSEKIYAFNDLYISPITYEYSAQVLMKLVNLKIPGVFHLSGEKDFNYYEICCEINKILLKKGMKLLNAVSVKSTEKGVTLEDQGQVTKLGMEKTSKILDVYPFEFREICNYIIDFF